MSEIYVIEKKNSAFTEEIKRVRTNIKFSALNGDKKTIVITSSTPGEGKSIVSANLAAAFAMNGSKTLLIDCDLRKGRQKKIFLIQVAKEKGLSNLLIEKNIKKSYKSYIQDSKIENLSILPTGPFPPNPSELLSSEKFKELLEVLKNEYEYIFIDCPPVNGLNDSLVVSSMSDMSIIVCKHKKTSIDLLEKTKKQLDAVGARVAGVIINQIDKKGNNYYYNHYYSYSYYKK